MPLELRRNNKGGLVKSWYGRYETDKRRHCLSLGVRVQGRPPASGSLRDLGDAAFERSRTLAQAKLDALVEEASTRHNASRLVEKAYMLKTGEPMRSPKLESLADDWDRIPRRRRPKPAYLKSCRVVFERFAAHVRARRPEAVELGQVGRDDALSFLEMESDRGVSGRTWNHSLTLLRSAMRHLLPPGYANPFDRVPTRELETIFRAPYSPADLRAIVEAARDDDFIRPIIVTGMCTAMRRGDCCLLRWRDVDLPGRFISVKTAKTGQTVSIPIFPLLLAELETRPRQGDEVFPEQAEMYRSNPDGITYRVRGVLRRAGFVDEATTRRPGAGGEAGRQALPALAPETLRARAAEAVGKARLTAPKRRRMLAALDAYLKGATMAEAARQVGCAKGTVSALLNEVERLAGAAVVRRAGTEPPPAETRGAVDTERPHGLRRASVRDFHSFRVTWVTLALTAGVPVELVTRVTGHQTTDVVLKHYFQPDREDFRRALQAAMPELLTGGGTSPLDEMRLILDQTDESSWRQDVGRLQAIHARLAGTPRLLPAP